MLKLGGATDDGQDVQRAKYIISTSLANNNTITLNGAELIPINWEGRLISQPSVSVNELGKQLLKAAADGTIDKVKQLLTKGAPFTADWLGTSPLHLAAQNDNLEITEILLRAGISKDARTKVDRTPLHMASYEGHVDIVETLLKHGADINCRDLLDMTPLHWAVQNGHIEVVNLLVKYGALIEVPSKFDVTPVMIAQQTGRSDIEEILIGAINNSAIASQNLVLQLNAGNVTENDAENMFSEDMELEETENQEFGGYTLVREPILIEEDMKGIDIDQETSQEATEQEDLNQERDDETEQVVDASALTNSLKILEEHGITMLQNDENDDGNILNTVMESGHSVVLTDVGKEVLNSVKQSEQRKQSQTLHMDKKFLTVTPEQFLAMTNNHSSKNIRQMKVIPSRGTFKRVVMKKNKIIPIAATAVAEEFDPILNINRDNGSQSDLELVMSQLIEARKTIEEYKIKLRKKEQEVERYKMQLKLLVNPS
ncbi:unnamed protein product [Psylliodes chrysocephalus]|uniref:Uncharacterized protein n=1 Tax=Psylliodes chrysocephalus TaxID=3402493 RepID=A0A9P0D494_9CUCU|nr:unnamed protein product [Psylliodes chrysocephala]